MDVKLNVQSTKPGTVLLGLFVFAISLIPSSVTVAELVFASDSEVASTVYITDDAPAEPPQAPASVEGSVVFVDDAPVQTQQPAAQQPVVQQPAARFVSPMVAAQPFTAQPLAAKGDIKVVSSQQPVAPRPTAVRPIPVQKPLAPIAKLTSTELTPADQRELSGDIHAAVHAEPVLGPIESTKQVGASPEAQLIAAYQLSLTATKSNEYTKIAIACGEAMSSKLKGDQRIFARQLASWALNRRGQLRAESDDADLANADFLAALEYNPRNWRALHNRGVSYAQAGAFAEAFDDFNAVIQINPKYSKAYGNRATLYVQAKDLNAAIADYQRAIENDRQFATAHVGLGRVYHMLGRWDDALDQFSAAIDIEPSNPNIVCSRGDLHADLGNYGEALADYARTIEIDPEFGHAYRNGAWLLATCPDDRFRDPENAVLGAQQALEYSYGERHVALDTLAAALAANNKFDEAVSTVTQAVDLAPEDTKFTYLSRMQLYQQNQPFRTEPVGDVSQVMYEASDR